MRDFTQLLHEIDDGDQQAAAELLPQVYEELRKLAAIRMSRENPGQTLQATALVHEAYLRLIEDDPSDHWDSRGHFFSAAAEAMRRILVESARAKSAQKRGGDMNRIPIDCVPLSIGAESISLIDLDDALTALKQADPQSARLVELRYFSGLEVQEIADILGISRRKAHYMWDYARSWLRKRLRTR